MKSYLPIWILLIILLVCVGAIFLFGWEIFPGPTIGVLMAATVVALLVIANELRRPEYQEYNRRKALYPEIPDKFLADIPSSGSVIFGKDYRTGKTVFAEPTHHSQKYIRRAVLE